MEPVDESPTPRPRLGAAHVVALKHVARGRSDEEIAELMGLTPAAVQDILGEASVEYGVTTRAELTGLTGTKVQPDS